MPDFDAWMQDVDVRLIATIGLGHDDLPDRSYYSMWEDEYTPQEVVDELLEELENGEF